MVRLPTFVVCGSHFRNFISFLFYFICGTTCWSRHWSHHLFIYFCHHSILLYSTLSDRKVPILFFLDILSGKVWFVLVSSLFIILDILSAFWGLVATSGYFIFSARFRLRPDSHPYTLEFQNSDPFLTTPCIRDSGRSLKQLNFKREGGDLTSSSKWTMNGS